MNKIAVFLIADLHLDNDPNECHITTINHNSTSNIHENKSKQLLDSFKETIIEYKKNYEVKYIFAGDIINKGKTQYFDLFDKLLTYCEIKYEDVLIIPGNHDFNRENFRRNCLKKNGRLLESDKDDKKNHEFLEDKFIDFKEFLIGKKESLNFENAIHDYLITGEILFIGLNTTFKYDDQNSEGYFDVQKTENELEELKINIEDYDSLLKIGVLHANIVKNYNGEVPNENYILSFDSCTKIFEQYNIEHFIVAHNHTGNTSQKFFHSKYGSKHHNLSSFSAIPDLKENGFSVLFVDDCIRIQDYNFVDKNNGQYTFNLSGQGKNFVEANNVPKKPKNIIENELKIEEVKNNANNKSSAITYQNTEKVELFSEKLFELIKEKNAFKSGHFHWSDSSRSHNWIDIPCILQERQSIELAQEAIITLVEEKKIEFDAILSLGIEGNIIANKLAMNSLKPYSFLPYSYRYKDHAMYEKEIKFSDEQINKIYKLLIITDVVHEGTTIMNIEKDAVDPQTKKLFEKLNTINVVSLLYTNDKSGEKDINVGKYKFEYVLNLKVLPCPYGNDAKINCWKTNCEIYTQKLDKIHLFYDDESYLK